jgi:tetratricopeptide (TPR) repeat protein
MNARFRSDPCLFSNASDADVARLLAGATTARSNPQAARDAIDAALAARPDDRAVRIAAYKLCFYTHRYREAVPHSAHLLRDAARSLNIAADWHLVQAGDAPFGEIAQAPGFYLQALIALGYCHLRAGDAAPGRAMLDKAVELDPTDRFGAGRLIAVIDRAAAEDVSES